MADEILSPSDPNYDELTEELKALRTRRTRRAAEYAADPEKFLAEERAKERARWKDPTVTFGVPGRTFKTEEEMDEYYEELDAKDARMRVERESREKSQEDSAG